MIDLIAAAGIGGVIGAGIMAWRTAGRVSAALEDERHARDEAASQKAIAKMNAEASHLNQSKLSAIRDLVGPTEGLRRGRLGQIAAILDGEWA